MRDVSRRDTGKPWFPHNTASLVLHCDAGDRHGESTWKLGEIVKIINLYSI